LRHRKQILRLAQRTFFYLLISAYVKDYQMPAIEKGLAD